MRLPSPAIGLAAFALGAVVAVGASAQTFFNDSGNAPADIQDTVDDFRNALGDLNPPQPQNFVGGRREINWDAAPDSVSDPNPFPGDFFNANAFPRARGLEVRPNSDPDLDILGSATGFQLSSNPGSGEPELFGFPDVFQSFSPNRLFAPTGGTVFDVLFFDPADPTTRGVTNGFGAVFANVTDEIFEDALDPTVTSAAVLLYRDLNGDAFDVQFVERSDQGGLSFAGAIFDTAILAQVTIVAGILPIDADPDLFLPLGAAEFEVNPVALDDFIYGEPTAAIPLPAGVWMMLAAFGPFAVAARRRRRGKTDEIAAPQG